MPSPTSPIRTMTTSPAGSLDAGVEDRGCPALHPDAVRSWSGGRPDALVELQVGALEVGVEVRLGLADECLAVDLVDLHHGPTRFAAPPVEHLLGLVVDTLAVFRADVADGLEQGVLLSLAHLVQRLVGH